MCKTLALPGIREMMKAAQFYIFKFHEKGETPLSSQEYVTYPVAACGPVCVCPRLLLFLTK